MTPKFSLSGTEHFDESLNSTLKALGEETHDAFGRNLHSLVLGGSYGRGEGAVILSDGEEKPFGDIDLITILEEGDRGARKKLERIARRNREFFGIEIDFAKEILARELPRTKPSLFWQDMRIGSYKVIIGDGKSLVECLKRLSHGILEPAEAAKLLLSRGVDLLRALRICDSLENEPGPGYLARSYWRCRLSLGDSLLIAFGQYAAKLDEKIPLLLALEDHCPAVKDLGVGDIFKEAIKFRRESIKECPKPSRLDLEELAWKWGSIFLFEEKRRLNGLWRNLSEYCESKGRYPPSQHENDGLFFSGLRRLIPASRAAGMPRFCGLPVLLGLAGKPAAGPEWSVISEKYLMNYKHNL